MRHGGRLIFGVAMIVVVVLGSVLWLHDHEADGRSDYEKLMVEERPDSLACPRRRPAEGEIGDLNENPDSGASLVPGEPDRLLLCRYLGLNHGRRSLKLAKRRVIADRATIRHIARELNELPPFPKGAIACPSDGGARTYALFGYSDSAEVVVELSFKGCPAATNGHARARWIVGAIERQVGALLAQ